MTTIPDYITTTDVSALVPTDAYTRLFDPNGAGSVSASYLQRCVDDSCSQWQVWTGAALPGDWTANGSTVEGVVKRHIVNVVCYFAAAYYPGAGTGNPYRQGYMDAKAFAEALNRDRDARLVTSAPGRALPRANLGNTQDPMGNYTNPYSRAANREDPSGF